MKKLETIGQILQIACRSNNKVKFITDISTYGFKVTGVDDKGMKTGRSRYTATLKAIHSDSIYFYERGMIYAVNNDFLVKTINSIEIIF